MDRDQVLQKVSASIAEVMDLDADTIDETTSFKAIEADSLDRIEIITDLEDQLGIVVDDDDLDEIETVGDAVDAIMRML